MRIPSLPIIGSMIGALSLSLSAHAEGISGAPAPFDKGNVKIAVVSYLGGGDWLQAFEAGVSCRPMRFTSI